jgi:GR25 family glycosyltransferase involved in LPS biosynthesis
MNVFVIHYTKLKERKTKMLDFLSSTNFKYEFITDYDQEEINKENIKLFYLPDEIKFKDKVSPLWDYNFHQFRYLKFPEVSVAIKHILAIKKIAESSEEYGIILEDDALSTTSNLKEKIQEIITNLPNDWDAAFLGEGCGEDFTNFKLKNFQQIHDKIYKANHPATNCAEAYILKKSSAQKIYENIIPFQLPFDWELAYVFYKLKMNIYWAIPQFFAQGSKNGTYNTSIQL